MPFPVLGSNSAVAEFAIDNSLRFNSGDSPKLEIDYSASATNRKKWTASFWAKRGIIGSHNQYIFGFDGAGFIEEYLMFESSNGYLQFDSRDASNSSSNVYIRTDMLFRDPSAWYHIVVAVDSTDATEGNRFKVYVNGTQQNLTTSTAVTQNYDFFFNETTGNKRIGTTFNNNYYDGYLSEFHFIDGQQLDSSYFGETNDNGVWIPKEYEGTYGNNGFFLEFQNSGSLGTDTSGNGNNFTATNLTATDQTTDTPTNNFATWNDLHKASNVTLSEGNCKAAIAGTGQTRSTTATIAVNKGKWYWEIKYTADVVSGFIGLVSADIGWNINSTDFPSSGVSDNVGYNDGGNKYVNGTLSSYGDSFTTGDIISVAANLDDDEVVFYKNGTAQNSGTAISKTFSGNYFLVVQHQSSSGTSNFELNTGNPSFSISSGNSDANGYGNFEYAVPSGYYALCTKNLAEYG